MSAADPTPFKFSWYLTVAVGLLLFVVVAGYSWKMAHETPGYDDNEALERTAKLEKMQATDTKTLTTADWIDQTKGTVRIPIDEAMPQEVALLKAKPVAVGSAIAGLPAPAPAKPANAPAATTTTTTTNAAPAANSPPSVTGQPASSTTPVSNTNAAPATPAK